MKTNHIHFPRLSSTNDWAKAECVTFPRDQITLVTADLQTEGRGQYGRRWHSPEENNLYATFSFFTSPDPGKGILFIHLLAAALIELLHKEGVFCTLKPPNDLLIQNKKVAGILCETKLLSGHEEAHCCFLLGIGVNLNMSNATLETIDQPATSLQQVTGRGWLREPLLYALCTTFSEKLQAR